MLLYCCFCKAAAISSSLASFLVNLLLPSLDSFTTLALRLMSSRQAQQKSYAFVMHSISPGCSFTRWEGVTVYGSDKLRLQLRFPVRGFVRTFLLETAAGLAQRSTVISDLAGSVSDTPLLFFCFRVMIGRLLVQ